MYNVIILKIEGKAAREREEERTYNRAIAPSLEAKRWGFLYLAFRGFKLLNLEPNVRGM